MTFESKYGIGDKFVLGGCPCIILSIEFKNGSEEVYTVQWVNPFTKTNAYMTRTELDNSISMSDFLVRHNRKENESSEALDTYDAVVKEFVESSTHD